jgi:PAS domain S-box-containing protein
MTKFLERTKKSAGTFQLWLAAVVLLVDLSVVVLALLSLHQSWLQYRERAEVQAQNLSQALEYSIAGIADKSDLALLCVVDEVQRQIARGAIDGVSLNSFITRQHGRLPELDSIRVADAQGQVWYGTGVVAKSVINVADRDYFLQLQGDPGAGLVISKPMLGRISGKWVLVVARRVSNPDGSFAGAVYGPIALEQIQKILASIDVGPSGGISLRDGEMGLIVRTPKHNGVASIVGNNTISPELRQRVQSGKKSGTFFSSTSSNNVAKVSSYRRIASYPLYIIVGLATSDYLAQWWRDLAKMSTLVALFIAVTLVLSRFAFLRWRREKEALDALRSAKEELEQRVTERTAELFQSNSLLTTELAERERAEQRLRMGRNMLAQIIDVIPQSVFWKDRDSVYLGCNTVFALTAGLEHPSGVAGRTDFDLPWLAEEARAYRDADRDVMENNRPKYHIIERMQHADGSQLWVDTTKIPLSNETGEVYGVLGVFENITQRKSFEESRNKALAFIESLLAASPTGIQVFEGGSGDCVLVNQAIAGIVGGSVEELSAQNFRKLASWHEVGFDLLAEAVLSDGVTRHMEKSVRSSFGKSADLGCFLSRFEADGNPHLMCIAVDISEKRRLERENRLIEAQMLHVQKLESLGVLAGGIAHDFNNILMVVLGNADLALMRITPESPARENLMQIEQAAGRAADLARQMLAYSGKGRFVIENLSFTAIVEEMTHMLEVSISKRVVLRYNHAPDLPAVSGDATQLRQVILNLVINASEAIGDDSGVIAISTGVLECDRAYLSDSWIDDRLPEGLYVILEVADTGCGIDRETIPKIFDPFFTTKFTGRGLGMAAVLGIVRGHKGAIRVQSEKGKGTSFKLLLPALTRRAELRDPPGSAEGGWRGSGTVLLVDDEETIRDVGKDILQAIGFSVLTASDGQDALEVFARNKDDITCVLLDLTMPRLDGEQTFRELHRLCPELRVIISSGYNEQEITQKFVGKGLAGFIQKPYRVAEVARKLREVLVDWKI